MIMSISETAIAQVVAEASSKMNDPKYISQTVDLFVGSQPMIARYVMSYQSDVSTEGVVSILFHAALIFKSISKAFNKAPSMVSIPDLDQAARTYTNVESLAEVEPDLASYIATNFSMEGESMEKNKICQKVLSHISYALVHA